MSKSDPFSGRGGGGRAGEMSGKKERQRGREKSERGSETGGFRPQATGLPSVSGRPLSRLVKKTLFYSEELSWFFRPLSRSCAQTMVSSPRVSFFFSPLYFFFTSIICREDVAFPRHVRECEGVFVSQQHPRV